MGIATAEKMLEDLAVRIDGRNALNGLCTWPDIRDTIELALSEISMPAVAPSSRLARERDDLEELENLAQALASRAHLIRISATHDNQCDVKLAAAA